MMNMNKIEDLLASLNKKEEEKQKNAKVDRKSVV